MSAAAFFNAARAYKRELTGERAIGLSDEDVRLLNEATVRRWKAPESPPDARTPAREASPVSNNLLRPAAFYGALRASLGDLTQQQVDGFNVLLAAIGAARWPIAWAAYGLATAWWETAKTMQPVEEAFWKDDAWRRRNLRYYPWHGRGYVQLTWQANYEKASEELQLGQAMLADPKLAMRPDIASKILVRGMEQGWFTKKKLADYLPIDGEAGHEAFKQARRIINGTDKWVEIAKLAEKIQAALKAGGWA